MHLRRVLVPVLVLGAYAYLTCAPTAPQPHAAIDDDMPQATTSLAVTDAPRTIEELRRRIERILERDHLPGIAIGLVGRDGPIWVGGIGVRDRASGAPMTSDTMFRVGSLSKSITALGVMRLADQGKLDIDRPLREILPEVGFVNPWEDVAPVTLAQCLEHTAGFDDIRFNEIFTSDEHLSVTAALALNPRSRIVRWRPGTRHAYSNVGYTLAARAIEVASGEPFDVYIKREILAPMGIVDSDFARTGTIPSRLATGYQDDGPVPFHVFAHRPSAGLLTSAADLTNLVQFWLAHGEGYPPIVSEAGLARIERSGTLPYPHLDNDYGFANYGDVQHPVFSRGHDGGMPGFHSSFRYFRNLGVGYVMLLNANYAFRGYFEIRSLLFSYLTQGRTLPAPLAAPAGGDRPGAEFFALGNPRSVLFDYWDRAHMGWFIRDLGDTVRVNQLDGPGYTLLPTPDGGYRMKHECGSSVRFLTNSDGKPIMIMSFLYAEGAPYRPAQILYFVLRLTVLMLAFAPLWAAGVLFYGAARRRRVLPLSLILWPAVAGFCCTGMPHLLFAAFNRAVIGIVHPLTIAFCGLTILFAVASTATLVQSIRWSLRPDRPRLRWRLFPMLCGVAFFGLSLWLAAHGWIGLRTWAW